MYTEPRGYRRDRAETLHDSRGLLFMTLLGLLRADHGDVSDSSLGSLRGDRTETNPEV